MGRGLQSSQATARAGLLAAAVLLVLALPSSRPLHEACPHPTETLARAGRSVEAACGARPAGVGKALRGPARLLFGLSIDPNHADLQTLEALPGIGPVRALAILRERERGRFLSLDDLQRVRGIGPRTLERLVGLVEVADTPR